MMPERHRHRMRDHLIEDEETGFTHYRSQMIKRWDGIWTHKSKAEYDHPQKYIRAKADPYALRLVRPDELVEKAGAILSPTIGNATRPAGYTSGFTSGFKRSEAIPYISRGPAAHLYDLTLSEMAVGCTWIVR